MHTFIRNLFLLAGLALSTGSAFAERERVNFDAQWHFAFGHAADPAKDFGCGTEYFNYYTKANSIHNEGPYALKFTEDSTRWRVVDLPFDFVVDLPFASKASYSHGHKTVGWQYPATSVGWYRKTFNLPETDRGQNIHLQLDGVYRNARVWVNGILVGEEPSGYAHQDYDITDYLFFGEGAERQNLVCVRADATFEEGWFYEGGGIYRHTWLTKTAPLHVENDGVFVHAHLNADYSQARVVVETEVLNDLDDEVEGYSLRHLIVDGEGRIVAETTAEGSPLKPRASQTTAATLTVTNPELWDLNTPYLYNVKTEVVRRGEVVDSYAVRTGIRDIRMDKDEGFFLNGRHVKLKGFNNHQDHPGVGAAIPDGLQRYRMERLKALGANAYRASHNPMTTELLDVCDELGILVFEENRLMGVNDFHMHVALNMVKHDRNHPCVFLWGIANEEWGLEWDDRSVGIARNMCAQYRLVDSTRMVAAASSSGPKILLGTDVAGYNYVTQHPIDEHRRNYPDRLALGSEETTGCGTRGVYFDAPGRMPALNRSADKDGTVNRIERGWKFYDERPWLMGCFFWTGFDYRGEPVPLDYPATGSLFGVLDYCGFPKDEAYYLQAWWNPERPLLHILPHWNLQGHEGDTISLWAYSNCDEVELRVNGKNLGRKAMPRDGHLEWEAVYQPGYVEATGYKNGKRVARERIETTGPATQVETEQLRYGDVTVINVTLRDKKKRFVPTACEKLVFTLQAPPSSGATILGYGNGDSAFTDVERPADPSARSLELQSFNGHAQVIVKSAGDFTFTLTL